MDGATFTEDDAIGTCAVIRDWKGKFIAAATGKCPGGAEALRAEVLVMKEGLILAKNLGIRALKLEGDAKDVLDSFEQSSNMLSHNGIILSKAYSIAANFSFFKAQFIPRCCNLVADKLAKLARNGDTQIWANEPPSCIMDVLAYEACL